MLLEYLSSLCGITIMMYVHLRHECWTSQGSLSCSQWKCLLWLNSYRFHTQLYDRLWNILAVTASLFISVFGFCLWGIRSWKSRVVVLKDVRTCEPIAEMLSRGNRASPLTWEVMWVYPTKQCFLRLCHRKHLHSSIWDSSDRKTHWNWTYFETCSLLGLYAA